MSDDKPYKIERDVRPEDRSVRAAKLKSLFKALGVGESFFVPQTEIDSSEVTGYAGGMCRSLGSQFKA